MTDRAAEPKMPGSSGLPLLGQTLPFLRDSFGFIERGIVAHGPVFRSHILGRPTAIMAGPEACSKWIDPACVERDGAMPAHVKELFGGESLPSLDGAAHKNRKELVLAGFTQDALASYLPRLEHMLDAYFSTWEKERELAWVEELKKLAIQAICTNVLGMSPGADLDALLDDYAAIGPGFGSLPIPFPGTAFSRARKALARIFVRFEAIVRAHQQEPRDDGLSRMLAAKTASGTTLGVDDAVRELHHIVVAGLIIWGEFAATAMLLDRHSDVREKLADEIRREASGGPVTLGTFRSMPYLAQTVMEVKRLCPIVPAQFGRAKADFEIGGHTVPKGWMVMWGVHSTNLFAPIYTKATEFDPDRFSPERAEHRKHEHAFSPQGPGKPGGHRCPGLDFSTCFMSLFMIHLVRDYDWELPPQDLAYRWNMIPPEPTDGLRARLSRHARQEAAPPIPG